MCVICSEFSDIFDTDWFISYLSKDVTVVKRIPYEVMISMDKLPWTMRAPRKSMPEFYIDEVLPILMRRRVSKLTKRIGLELVAYYSVFIEYMLLFIASILVKHVIVYKQKIFLFAVFLLITFFNFKITIVFICFSASSYMYDNIWLSNYLQLHGQLGRLICWLREYILISLLLRGILNAVLIGIIYEIIIVICE